MEVKVTRVTTGPDGTFGVFIVDGEPVAVTCENLWVNNNRLISCIPDGKYEVSKFSGTKYKNVWQLHDVPSRSAILIHNGNLETDTEGCILAGESFANFNGLRGIANSVKTIGMLRNLLPDEFILTVSGLNFVVK